jgi:hypothetical protein
MPMTTASLSARKFRSDRSLWLVVGQFIKLTHYALAGSLNYTYPLSVGRWG